MGKRIKAPTMRQRRAMQHAIGFGNVVDIGVISKHHRRKRTVRKCGAFWFAGSTARIEQPSWILPVHRLQIKRIAREECLVLAVFDTDHSVKRGDFVNKGSERFSKIGGYETDSRARIFENVSELPW